MWGMVIASFLASYFNAAKLYKTIDGRIGLPKEIVSSIEVQGQKDSNPKLIDPKSTTVWIELDWLLQNKRRTIVDTYTQIGSIFLGLSLVLFWLSRKNQNCEPKNSE